MDEAAVRRWFAEYLEVFEACGRGEREPQALLDYYGIPMLATTDEGCFALVSEEQVVAVAQQQVDGMRAAAYDSTEELDSDVFLLNAASALYRGTFLRRRADGGEISRLAITYLVTDGAAGRRISALALHGP